jgi:hypothetical protein
MSAVTGYIGVLKNSSIEIEGTDFANQMTRSRLVPDVPGQQVRTLVPDGTVSDTDSASWTWEIAGIQKVNTGGLVTMLNAATPGTLLDVEWEPVKDTITQPHYVFQVVAQPVPIGGDQGAFAQFEAVLQVAGQPVNTPIVS